MQKIDLTGCKFGRLTVIEQAESSVTPNGSIRTMWRCKCDCGTEVIRSSQNLRNAKEGSCGCIKRKQMSDLKLENLIGQRFGRLVVVSRVSSDRYTKWHCKCDCGNECDVLASNLKNGHTQSCGCLQTETRKTNRLEHGYRHTRIYTVWSKIKGRCFNTKDPRYSSYGGRGIVMCDEWKDNPAAFIEWAYANGYDENAKYGETTIDRIDNNKGYSPENCRIANETVQSNNRRTNRKITYKGETHTVAEWARILDVKQSTLITGLNDGRTIEFYITKHKPRNTHPNK